MPSNTVVTINKAQFDSSGSVNPAFLRCNLNNLEICCLFIVIFASIVLQIDPVLNSAFADIILIGAAAISWLTPVSGFAYIAAAQILPIPPESLINPAEIGFYTWLIVTPLRYRRFAVQGWPILLAFLPWLLWFSAISGQNVFAPDGEYAKALYYGVIGIQLANEAKGEYLKCLMGLCLGCLTVSFGYWASQVGLPVSLSKYGGIRGKYIRLGGVRADSVMVWPPLLMGCFGFLGIVLANTVFISNKKAISKVFYLSALVIVFITIPCLIATMTHGAVSGFVLTNLFLLAMYFNPDTSRYISTINKRHIRNLFVLSFAVILVFFLFNVFGISGRILTLLDYYLLQSKEMGVAASRTDVWRQALQLILDYPTVGVFGNDATYRIQNLGAIKGADFLAHNVFLDYGWQVGLPGLIFLAAAFFLPIVYIWKSKRWLPFAGFLCFYFACFIFWMTLSFQFYKTVWAFWALFCVAGIRSSRGYVKYPKALGWLAH
jgi:hypothetical protein